MILGYQKPSQLQGLPRWLEIATEGLIAPAKERIRAEIEAHFSEAVAAHLAEGASETAAQAAALSELGDAEAAAKRFRKQHLTEAEVKGAESLLKLAGSGFGLAAEYLGFCFVYFLACYYPGKACYPIRMALLPVAFFMLVVFPTILFVMAKRRSA